MKKYTFTSSDGRIFCIHAYDKRDAIKQARIATNGRVIIRPEDVKETY